MTRGGFTEGFGNGGMGRNVVCCGRRFEGARTGREVCLCVCMFVWLEVSVYVCVCMFVCLVKPKKMPVITSRERRVHM